MKPTLPVCTLLLMLPCACLAGEPPKPTETVIRLTVQPMAAPKPALRYQLLPELREMSPGNPIQGYLKCFMEQNHFFFNKQSEDEREKWLTMPLQQLPAEKLLDYGAGATRQADSAARLDTPDWQILLPLKAEGLRLFLPDVQTMRRLEMALKVRFRAEVAARHFEAAIATAKTMFALSRHLGEHPTLIGSLVGIAIANGAVGPLEEMIQQPGCPNLFWALTDLPSPFIDLRKGMQGEWMLLAPHVALLDDSAPMTEPQLYKTVDAIRELMKPGVFLDPTGPEMDVPSWLDARVKDETYVRAARARLTEAGLGAGKLKQFPPLQVILLDEKLAYEVRSDESTCAASLPFWQAETLLVHAEGPNTRQEESLLARAAPTTANVQRARARLDQRLALLRCVEALRLYAAGHDGRLPTQLADIQLPLPIDPMSGKPFVYGLEGGVAILRGTPPRGMEKAASFNVRYEVTLRK